MTNPLMYHDHRRQALGPQDLHRGADRPRRHHARRGRGVAARLPGPSWRRSSRRPATPRPRRGPPPGCASPRAGAAGRDRDRRRRCCSRIGDAHVDAAGRLHPAQADRSSCWSGGPRWPSRATSTGASARSSRSARCSTRASPCGWPARTPAAARSSSGTPRRRLGHRRGLPAAVRRVKPTTPGSSCTTRCSVEFAAMGFEYGYSVGEPRRARAAGRPSSATSSTARSPSWTSSSRRARRSGASASR